MTREPIDAEAAGGYEDGAGAVVGESGLRGARARAWRIPQVLRRHPVEPTPPPPVRSGGVDAFVRDVATWAGRFLLIVAAAYVLWRMLDAIGMVTFTMTVAVMISAVLRPIVNALVRWGVVRWLAAPLVFLLGVAALALSAWFVISQVSNSMGAITTQLQNANDEIFRWLVQGPLHMSETQVSQLSDEVAQYITRSQGALVSGAWATATGVLTVLGGIVLCLFTLLFLLLDDGAIWRWVVGLFPSSAQERVVVGGEVAWRTLVAYMRSTVLLAFINAATMVVIMLVGRIELYLPLGVLLFLGSLIPMVGMLVAGLVLVLVALVMNGPITALVMLIALFLTVQLEGNLLNPYILGKAVNIHPLAILATVTGGTLVAGIFGAFVAVPFVAMVNNVAMSLRPTDDVPDDQLPYMDTEDATDLLDREGNPRPVTPAG